MTPKPSPLTELIHAVLDGQASNAEARELEVRLAADPAARVEFEEWKRLFEALDAMPQEHAPEGLVASIVSAMPEARGAPDAANQPFPGRRVLGHTLSGISHPVPTRSVTMSEQSSRRIFAHRKAWLGGGIAAAVAVVVAQIALDFPIPKDVVGTVIPAQRYRAAQNGSEQVQLGTRADQAAPTSSAEKSAAESAVQAERVQAELMMQKQAERVQAERMQKQAERVQPELTMQKQAERTQAELTMQKQAERTQAELTMQKQAERTQAELMMQKQAERVQAERMQKQAERVQADRTSQQQ